MKTVRIEAIINDVSGEVTVNMFIDNVLKETTHWENDYEAAIYVEGIASVVLVLTGKRAVIIPPFPVRP